MKKEEPLSPSSSRRRRENSPERNNLQAKSIGCMSSFLKFIYGNNNGRRSLTFGKKNEKNVQTCKQQSSKKANDDQQKSSLKILQDETLLNNISHGIKRLSCDVPRSPTLPADIRRSNATASSSPAIVVRLMGLEEKNNINVRKEESTAEKRRKLLGALEKCDEDLKALKKIIEIVTKTSDNSVDGEKDKREEVNKKSNVIDEFTRSALNGYSKRCIYGRVQQKKRPGEEEETGIVANICFGTGSTQAKKGDNIRPTSSSTPMAESVNEVCRDIAWGVKREVGRIGLALQDNICRELIEEIVKEMECCSSGSLYYKKNIPSVLPFEACKRRLSF
ncbi:hypothetical protein ACFE04_029319 [Oxalis oulophora]